MLIDLQLNFRGPDGEILKRQTWKVNVMENASPGIVIDIPAKLEIQLETGAGKLIGLGGIVSDLNKPTTVNGETDDDGEIDNQLGVDMIDNEFGLF